MIVSLMPADASGHPLTQAPMPRWIKLASAAAVLVASSYVVACVVRIVLLYGVLHDAGAARSAIAVRLSFDSLRISALVNLVIFWIMYGLFVGWVAGIEYSLADSGVRPGLRRASGVVVWYFGVAISAVGYVALLVNPSPVFDPADGVGTVTGWIHVDVIVVVSRAVAGLVNVWCAVRFYQTAKALRPMRLAPDAPYYMPPPLNPSAGS